MIVKHLVKNSIDKSPEEIIYDTTMMFVACAAYVLHERNGFEKNDINQFLADVEQVNRENEYQDLQKVLKEKCDIDCPDIRRETNEQLSET